MWRLFEDDGSATVWCSGRRWKLKFFGWEFIQIGRIQLNWMRPSGQASERIRWRRQCQQVVALPLGGSVHETMASLTKNQTFVAVGQQLKCFLLVSRFHLPVFCPVANVHDDSCDVTLSTRRTSSLSAAGMNGPNGKSTFFQLLFFPRKDVAQRKFPHFKRQPIVRLFDPPESSRDSVESFRPESAPSVGGSTN